MTRASFWPASAMRRDAFRHGAISNPQFARQPDRQPVAKIGEQNKCVRRAAVGYCARRGTNVGFI